MGGLKSVMQTYLRGRLALYVVLHLAPLAVLVVLGSLWLGEHGLLLPFVLITTVVIAGFRLINRALAGRVRPTPKGEPLIAGNPEWTEKERSLFQRLSAEIRGKLTEPMPWPALQQEALVLLNRAAHEVSGGQKGAMDFSIPEALLLADRVIGRLRGDLRRYVPMADMVRVSTLLWMWTQRRRIEQGMKVAHGAWRLRRVAMNPMGAVLQEVQSLLMSPSTGALKFAGQTTLQQVILEEVAAAAIDLHAGYLRYTEAELLEIELSATEADLGRMVVADQPLRVLVVGQVSAGKTSLINALAGEALGETDMAPTTPGLTAHPLGLGAADFTFVDSAGIDGSKAVEDRLLAELLQADLVIWALRANRPARAPDVALLSRLRHACDQGLRRRPPVIVALTGVDLLLKGWPFAEHRLPPDAMSLLGDVITSSARDLDEPCVVPLCLTAPEWNLAALETLILSHASEALMVQRNRRRLESKTTVRTEVAKGLAGFGRLTQMIASRWKL